MKQNDGFGKRDGRLISHRLWYCALLLVVLLGAVVPVSATETSINATYNYNPDEETPSGQDWATISRAEGDGVSGAGTVLYGGWTSADTGSNTYAYHVTGFVVFDTSGIPDTDTITGATVEVYGNTVQDDLTGNTINASIIDCFPTSTTVGAVTDYSKTTFTRQAADIPYASVTDAGWNTWTLTNLTYINKTGKTVYMLEHSGRVDGVSPGWAASGVGGFKYGSIAAGAIPRMNITHSAAASGNTTTYPIQYINETRITQVSTNLPPQGLNISINASPDQYEAASFVIKPDVAVTNYNITASVLTNETGGTIPASAHDIKVVIPWYQASDVLDSSWYDGTMKYVLTPELLVYNKSIVRVNRTAQTNELYDFNTNSYFHIDNTTIDTFPSTFKLYDNKTSAGFPQLFAAPAEENQQVWDTFHVPAGTPAGNYTGTINISSSSTTTVQMNFSVRVLPVTLPDSSMEHAIYYRGKPLYPYVNDYPVYDLGSENKSQAQIALELADMKAHGIQYPTMYDYWYTSSESPSAYGIWQSNFTQSLIARNQSGLPTDKLYLSNSLINDDQGHLTNPALQGASLLAKLNDIKSTTNAYGVGTLVGAGIDEPTLANTLTEYPALRTVYDNNSGTWYAINTAGRGQNIANVTSQVNINGAFNTTELNLWKSANPSTEVFMYGYPQSGVENPEIYRTDYGVKLWNSGYDGAMPFAYQMQYGQSIWNDYDYVGNYREEVFTYPTSNGVIDTIQWEGYREGVDDSRYADYLTGITGNRTNTTEIINADLAAGVDMSAMRNHLIDHILYYGGAVSPIASFTKNTTGGVLPLSVAFNDTSSNTPTMWNWSFGDGNWTNGTTQNATHTYESVGVFSAFLIASNTAGTNQSVIQNITVATIPVAGFAATAHDATVVFTDQSTNTPTSWLWQYNAHATPGWVQFSTAQNPSYDFVPGTYDINLTATNAAGSDSEVKESFIVVSAAGEGTVFPEDPSRGEVIRAEYKVDHDVDFATMHLIWLLPALIGIALSIYALTGKETDYAMLTAGLVSCAIALIILLVVFGLMPVIGGAIEG